MNNFLEIAIEKLKILIADNNITIHENLTVDEMSNRCIYFGQVAFYSGEQEGLPENWKNIICLQSDELFCLKGKCSKKNSLLHEMLHVVIEKHELKPFFLKKDNFLIEKIINSLQTNEESLSKCIEESVVRIISDFISIESSFSRKNIYGNDDVYSVIFYGGNKPYIQQNKLYENNRGIPNPIIEFSIKEQEFFNRKIKNESKKVINFLIKTYLKDSLKTKKLKIKLKSYIKSEIKRNKTMFFSKEKEKINNDKMKRICEINTIKYAINNPILITRDE